MTMQNPASKPLKGIRVLDLSRVLAGPHCTAMLADLGAEVIKFEVPGHGDDSRHLGPFDKNGESVYFGLINRGKRSVELDFKAPAGSFSASMHWSPTPMSWWKIFALA